MKSLPPTVFVLKNGERLEAHHFTIMAGSLRINEQGTRRTIPLSALDLKATIAENHERRIDLKIPLNQNEVLLGFWEMSVGCTGEAWRNMGRRRNGFPGSGDCRAAQHSKRPSPSSSRPADSGVISRSIRLAFLVLACTSWLYSQEKVLRPEPRAQNAAPTDPETLIKAVWENQKQLEAARKNYIFHRKEEEQEIDSQGRIKSREFKEYEVYYVGNRPIERLVGKDGKPLSERETRKQDEEVRKQEAKAREKAAKQESGEDPEKDAFTPTKFLAADRFYNLHRESYQGHEVYAMDFEPRPDFAPHSLLDKVLKSLGGTIWIDEQARQVVRLEARFLNSLKVGGGLLGSVQKGGNVVLEQRFVNNEIWMPSYDEVHLNARVFFLHKSINGTSTYSDYRKFRVDSKITGGSPLVSNPNR